MRATARTRRLEPDINAIGKREFAVLLRGRREAVTFLPLVVGVFSEVKINTPRATKSSLHSAGPHRIMPLSAEPIAERRFAS